MSEKKELNLGQLEKVNGGGSKTDRFLVCETNEILNFDVGDIVSIYSGISSGDEFQYVCDGTIITKASNSNNVKSGQIFALANGNSTIYCFNTDGICRVNGIEDDYWVGPQRKII